LRAAKIRAEGVQESQRITSEADRDVIVVKAQAQQQSDQIKGEGDGERNRIFAEAYGKDPEFFAFYRSMLAYEAGFKGETRAILSPRSDFFRYFSTPNPAPAPTAGEAPAIAPAPK
jgi:membrane protease subunit HflC